MISTAGMSTTLALSLISREREKFDASVQNEPQNARLITAFKEQIGAIKTVSDLMSNYQVYSFVAKAFGLGSTEQSAKAMNRQILTSDLEDKSSLANVLSNGKYKTMAETMGFDTQGNASANFTDPKWVDAMVARFTQARLVAEVTADNEGAGVALDAESKLPNYKSWYSVIGDENSAIFMRTALNLPESLATADVDAQKKIFASKLDLSELSDPERLASLAKRYAAITDATSGQNTSQNSILALFNDTSTNGVVTLDLESLLTTKSTYA